MKKYGNTVKKIKSDKLNFKKINLEIKNDKQKIFLVRFQKELINLQTILIYRNPTI